MELIRNGMPPLPVPLTTEMDDQLVSEGILPPQDGDVWRMDFSRFNRYRQAPPYKDSGGQFWSPHGVRDSHVPELFPIIRFTEELLPRG